MEPTPGPEGRPQADLVATAPSAGSPTEARLYQLLYRGEFGPQANTMGQRVRMLVWLRRLQLQKSQLRMLRGLTRMVEAGSDRRQRHREEVGATEAEYLLPIYADLESALLRSSEPSAARLEVLAARLDVARTEIDRAGDPRATEYRLAADLVAEIQEWLATLSGDQQRVLGDSLFFLQHRIGPFVAPGDYGELVGTVWDANEFGMLRSAVLAARTERHLDIGGLWSLGHLGYTPRNRLHGPQVQVVIFVALHEPELPGAIDSLLAADDEEDPAP